MDALSNSCNSCSSTISARVSLSHYSLVMLAIHCKQTLQWDPVALIKQPAERETFCLLLISWRMFRERERRATLTFGMQLLRQKEQPAIPCSAVGPLFLPLLFFIFLPPVKMSRKLKPIAGKWQKSIIFQVQLLLLFVWQPKKRTSTALNTWMDF